MHEDQRIYHALPHWLPRFADVMRAQGEAVTATRDETGLWVLHLSVRRQNGSLVKTAVLVNPEGPPVHDTAGKLVAWGILRLGPGVWTLSESIHVFGEYHGYVVLRDVPEPAPWCESAG